MYLKRQSRRMNGLSILIRDRAVAWSGYRGVLRKAEPSYERITNRWFERQSRRMIGLSDEISRQSRRKIGLSRDLKEKQGRRLIGLLISVLKDRAVAWAEYQSIEKGILTLMDVKDQSKMVG